LVEAWKELIPFLAEAMGRTLMSIRSDALVAGLDVYATTRPHKDKVPGLNVVAENLGVYFRPGSRAATKTK